MPDIKDLIPDIHKMLASPLGEALANETPMEVAVTMGNRLRKAMNREDRARKPNVLFPAELGHPCDRKTWYDFHYDPATMKPVEEIGPSTKIKFMYGDMVESLIIPLAKASGHTVDMVDETVQWQFPVNGNDWWTVRGRVDMRIDGKIVDVKSMAARSYDRWATEGIGADGFGYSAQVASYQVDSLSAPKPPSKQEGYILAIDKEGGKMTLVQTTPTDVYSIAKGKATAVGSPLHTLPRIPSVPEGKSGNMKLAMYCSYCKYKDECWGVANGGAGLRKFIYSFGPVWLTEVVREPKVFEAAI